MRLCFAVLLLLPASFAAAPTFRLPGGVKPARYDLELTVVPSEASFRGVMRIDVELHGSAKEVWLNSRDLVIDQARVISNGHTIEARTAAEGEFLGLSWDGAIPAGRARIEIAYRGEMKDGRNTGLYRKRAGDLWYAYTTFTPIEARRAFPCFDEPAYKAPWKVALNVPHSDTAVSNARMVMERAVSKDLKRVEFAETKPLPSELVALAVGPFDIVADGTAGRHRVPVRFLTPRGRAAEAGSAKGVTASVLARLEEYTGVPYPWDKLDHVAVLDMPFGAVENPGLITYRDAGLLNRSRIRAAEHRFRLRGLMAHELAHQWFGNLVTQAWWDDVWLSEGFATWLGVKVTELELPDFQRGLIAARERAEIMRMDASKRTRPVRMPVNSREDMAGVYSRFVYLKGAAVLRMIENWIGPEAFQRGIREYLRRHAGGTATTADLASSMLAGAGVDVSGVLDSHLNHAGFPVIRMECNNGKPVVSGAGPWTTPVCARGDGLKPSCGLVSGEPTALPNAGGCPLWWWPNRDGAGYFAPVMSPGDLGVVQGGWKEMTPAERLSFAEDLFSALAAKRVGVEAVRKLLPAIATDEEPNVAAAGYRILLAMIAVTPPEEFGKFESTLNDVLGRRRR